MIGAMLLQQGVPGYTVIHVSTGLHHSNATKGTVSLESLARLALSLVRVLRVLLRDRPDMVYLNLAQNTTGFLRDALYILTARVLGNRVIAHFHGGNFDIFYQSAGAPMRWFIRGVLRRLTRLIVLAEAHRCQFEGLLPAERVRVLRNAVPRADYDAQPARQPLPAEVTILFLGKLSYAKGFVDLMTAAPLILVQVPGARFVFAGEWVPVQRNVQRDQWGRSLNRGGQAMVRQWEGLRQQYGERFHYAGVVAGSEKARLFQSADIFVAPSYAEGFGLVVLEAMGAGLPVVVTPVGALPEVLQPNVNALFVEPGDVQGIAEAVVALARQPDLRQRLGRANRALVEQAFTPEVMAGNLAAIFAEALREQ
jgi:glycosyltransferase involved in cell wall biosynthesis